jgi:hypothetical protein
VDVLWATLQMYRDAASRGAGLALRNWPVLGSAFAYAAIMSVAAQFAAALGFAGGFLVSLVWSACVGSFLYLVEMIVRTSKVTLQDFGRSFGAYLWDVVGVTFIIWIAFFLITPILAQTPQGPVIEICLRLAIIVLFNAVPELIYLGHHSSLTLLSESYRFVADNWIEWFPPDLVLLAGLWYLWGLPVGGLPGLIAQTAGVALFVYFAMVVRGLLFLELSGSSRRGRAFRRRMGL